jgi:hypothetical protein
VSVPSGITLGEEWKFYEICVTEGHLISALFKSLNINDENTTAMPNS